MTIQQHAKRTIITSILLIFTASVFGQVIKEIQVIVNPTFSTRFLNASKEHRDTFNEEEEGMISYDIGILIVPFKKNRFEVSTGAIFSRKGYVWANYTGQDTDTGEPIDIKISETINYLEIPIRLTYDFTKDSKNYFVIGLLNDIFLNGKVKVTDDLFSPTEKEMRKYNLGVTLGLGHNFKIVDSAVIGIEPNLKFQTMSYMVEDTPAKRFLYTIGLTVNAKFELQKTKK